MRALTTRERLPELTQKFGPYTQEDVPPYDFYRKKARAAVEETIANLVAEELGTQLDYLKDSIWAAPGKQWKLPASETVLNLLERSVLRFTREPIKSTMQSMLQATTTTSSQLPPRNCLCYQDAEGEEAGSVFLDSSDGEGIQGVQRHYAPVSKRRISTIESENSSKRVWLAASDAPSPTSHLVGDLRLTARDATQFLTRQSNPSDDRRERSPGFTPQLEDCISKMKKAIFHYSKLKKELQETRDKLLETESEKSRLHNAFALISETLKDDVKSGRGKALED
ncbi:hypothetical protein ABW19_dt0201013 [Dactylella cylindrospora]|nr:hypothetical protein ABW19_dt0201013 [Dactylella cylindrospora]